MKSTIAPDGGMSPIKEFTMLVVIYSIILIAMVFSIMLAFSSMKAGAETGNKNGYIVGLIFIVAAIICFLLFGAMPPLKPTCALEGLL